MEGRPLEDQELVIRARGGDVHAYEELVRRYQDIAFRVAYHATGDAAEAEDATQEAFFKAYRSLDRFRPEAPLRPWLLRIVANEARNRRVAADRRERLSLRSAVPALAFGGTALSPEAAAEASETRTALVEALNELAERDRLVLTYRFILDLSEAETAAALDCAPGTVKSRTSRALQRLREKLGTEAHG